MGKPFDIRVVVIDQNQWYPIVASIDCNYWSVRPPADCHIRTVQNDANTEDDLPPNTFEALTSATPPPGFGSGVPQPYAPRYKQGDTVLYIKSQGTTMSVVARFVLLLALVLTPSHLSAQIQIPPVTATPVSIANGGTGQATATLGFNALAPCSIQGDVLYYNGTNWVCLATGTAGQALLTQGAAANPQWGATGYNVQFGTGAGSGHFPNNATTYYFGNSAGWGAPGTTDTDDNVVFVVPVAGRITAASFTIRIGGAVGVTETGTSTWGVRNNHSSTCAVASSVTYTASEQHFSATGLSCAVAAGDKLIWTFLTPTWVTKPTVVFYSSSVYISVP